jgi:hypothetical protein
MLREKMRVCPYASGGNEKTLLCCRRKRFLLSMEEKKPVSQQAVEATAHVSNLGFSNFRSSNRRDEIRPRSSAGGYEPILMPIVPKRPALTARAAIGRRSCALSVRDPRSNGLHSSGQPINPFRPLIFQSINPELLLHPVPSSALFAIAFYDGFSVSFIHLLSILSR